MDFTKFRPFHRYQSYYPYYLPSWYSRHYPKHYDRYFEPTSYWLERRQPRITLSTPTVQPTVELNQINNVFRITIIIAVLFVLFSLLQR